MPERRQVHERGRAAGRQAEPVGATEQRGAEAERHREACRRQSKRLARIACGVGAGLDGTGHVPGSHVGSGGGPNLAPGASGIRNLLVVIAGSGAL
jgi:hypothetical protein